MKALMLTREYPPHVYGGAGVVVDQLTQALAKRMQVEVRCFGEREPSSGPVTVRGYTPWERLKAGKEGPLFSPALETLSIGLAMARDPVDADVAHAHTWYADMGGLWIRTLHRIPLVVTLHSMEPLRPWKADQLGSGYLLSSWIEKTAVESADRVIAVSAKMRDDILEHFRGADPKKVEVIHNGIDPNRFVRVEGREHLERLGVKSPYVLYVGRITDQKGIFHLLDAARQLPPGVQVVLCASAPDTPEIEERLRKAVPQHPNVTWIYEMVGLEVVKQLYSHAAVFACPSVYEPFGLINLEAMACETPVVASAVGGIVEVVVDGETGYLVPPAKPDELATALKRVLDDPGKARAMGKAGRKRVEEKFSWDSVAARTQEVYGDAIAEFKRTADD
ncbi:MAG: glycogen synthase [Candidatus Rokubacteria bacterium]|nr:glycogen synthase [Candidatus Rokubacteria bacterium]